MICTIRAKILLLTFVLLSSGLAQNYYVDYEGGSDNNIGTSESSAFKHCPGDSSATGLAASIILVPGATIVFKGGVNYLGQVIINASGTADEYIVYMGSESWGSGKPIFDMENIREYGFKSAGAKHYISIQGIEFFNYNYGGDYVLDIDIGSTYWRIDNCAFGFMEAWADDKKHPIVSLNGGQSYIYLTNNEFFKSGHYTIRLRNANHIYIQNNNFGGINRSEEDRGWISVPVLLMGNPTHIYIQDNVFHDYWKYGGDQNPELHHSPDLIHAYAYDLESTGPQNIYIERNYFYNDHQFNTGSGTGDISISVNCDSVWIRNNVFVNSCQWWGGSVVLSNNANNIWVENNTFIIRNYLNPSAVYGLKIFMPGTGFPVGDNVYIYNNIFYNDDNHEGATCIEFLDANIGDFKGECDYNTYYNISGMPIGYSGMKTLAEFQALGYDTNSVFDNDGSNIFFNFPENPENSSQGDYSLNPVIADDQIEKGIPRNGYNDSFDGTLRPQGNGWDIGAHEYTNQSPVLEVIEDQSMLEGDTLKVQITAIDPDGDNITLTAENLPTFGSFNDIGDGTGNIIFTPAAGDSAVYSNIRVIANDDCVSPLADSTSFKLSVDIEIITEYSDIVEVSVDFTPKEFILYQNYPNPFNPSTKIKYTLPDRKRVNLTVYNTIGEVVAILVDEVHEEGFHDIQFNAAIYKSGVYFYRIQISDASSGASQSFIETKKMILLR
jgi:hypothetical protein